MAANRAAIAHTTVPDLRRMLPIIREAEREAAAALGSWLYKQSPDDRYQMHRHRALLAQLHRATELIEERLGPALGADLSAQGAHVANVSVSRLGTMIQAGSKEFEGAIRPLRLDVAAVVGGGERWMRAKFPLDGRRYGKAVADDIKRRLMLGVVRGETIDQMASRLLQSTGLTKYYKERGPGAVGSGVSARLFKTYRSWAEGTAQTALVDAYGEVAARGIREAEREDPGWLKEWDAAADMRVCLLCAKLDKKRVRPDALFFGKYDHPPRHQRCRCAVVPVRAEWTT